MAAIAKRTGDGKSTWRASCEAHPRFRGVLGSMRLAVKQADDHNRMFHPEADPNAVLAAALRERKKEAADAGS